MIERRLMLTNLDIIIVESRLRLRGTHIHLFTSAQNLVGRKTSKPEGWLRRRDVLFEGLDYIRILTSERRA